MKPEVKNEPPKNAVQTKKVEEEENDDWGDEWGFSSNKKEEDLDNFDYQYTNLNKLSNAQLEKHKKKMD